MNLYKQTKDYMTVKTAMDLMLSDDSDAYLDTLESMRELVSDSAEGLAKYVKELQAIEDFQKAEAKELAEQAKKTAAKREKIMQSIGECLTVMELSEVQAGAYQFKFKAGSTVTEVDESLLPKKYWVKQATPPPKPMTKPELKKIVDGGLSIKGVTIVKNPPKLELK